MPEPRFLLPPDLDFECTQCGRCCRDEWEIRVDARSAETLGKRDWSAVDPALAGIVPFERRLLPLAPAAGDDELPYTIARKTCGSCVFLTGNNLCGIHKELGLERKPQVCQQFPFLFAETPEGVSVGLSHYCPGVRKREGALSPPLESQLAELRRLHGRALRVARSGDRVLADDGLPLDWADYTAVEALLGELLATREVDPALALGACVTTAAMLVDFLAVKSAGKDEPPLGAARDFVTGWRRLGLGRTFEIARRQRPSPRAGRLLLRQFLALVDEAEAPGSAPGRALAGAVAFLKELAGRGTLRCAPLGAVVSVGAVRAVALDWDEAAQVEPLRRYAEHALFRRRLLPVLGVRTGLALLVLHVSAARFLARASAALEGRSRAEERHVVQAIQLVEKHYATHTRLDEAFARGPARALFRRIAARPAYALALLRA
jgi:Fe-S-cluster containining protein